MDRRTLYWGKKGRSFASALIRAADGNKQVTMMFADNVVRNWSYDDEALDRAIKHIGQYVKEGKFKLALARAFLFEDTREGKEIWAAIFDQLDDIN